MREDTKTGTTREREHASTGDGRWKEQPTITQGSLASNRTPAPGLLYLYLMLCRKPYYVIQSFPEIEPYLPRRVSSSHAKAGGEFINTPD